MRPDQSLLFNTSVSNSSESIDTDEGLDRSLTEPEDSSTSRHSPFHILSGPKTKIFNDMVHPHLELPGLCYRIINTPQFQRLRNLKQLGLCYHVYPSACHNRFEHCIGTSYLAGKYCKILQKNQPELEINDVDILCLYVGGLCHDLGHGPFSHTWEHFMAQHKKDYSHEVMSIRMLDYMIEQNGLWSLFQAHGLSEIDLKFIKELILGHPLDNCGDFQGRLPNKHFLYQIVSNDETKIDVDKFDYILRDCKQLNVTTAFDYERLLDNSRVFGITQDDANGTLMVVAEIEENTKTKIAYRKKISETLEDLFRGRFSLHQKAYQHKVTKIIEEMVLDGLNAAEPYFQITGNNGKVYKLSTAHEDISAFMKLTDSISELILNWGNGGPTAGRIFENILCRNLYKCLGYISSPFKDGVLQELEQLGENVVLIQTKINYGKGSENPLNCALFYEKSRPNQLFTQSFPAPKIETRCYIVLRPSNCDDNSTDDPTKVKNVTVTIDVNLEDNEDSDVDSPDCKMLSRIEKQAKAVLKKYNIRIESE